MAGALVFVAIYLTVPWYRTWEGRVIMAQKLLFVGFLINGVLYFVAGPDYPGRDAYRLVLFTAMPVVFWGMTILLIKARLDSSRREPARQDAAPAAEPEPDHFN
jgi:hypothetical protein